MSTRFSTFTLSVASLAAALTMLTGESLLGYAWWVVAPGLATIAVIAGIRRHQPGTVGPWWLLVAALALLWLGWTLSAAVASELFEVGVATVLRVVRDVIYLVAYPLLGIASLMLARARTGGRDRDNVIDAFIVMVALALLLSSWLAGSGDIAVAISGLDRIWVAGAPVVLAVVVTASIRLLFAAPRNPSAWLLFAAGSFTFAGNAWTLRLLRDGLPTQIVAIDVLWIIGFTCVAAATWHPSMSTVTQRIPEEHFLRGMPIDRLGLIGLALLAIPSAHFLWHRVLEPHVYLPVTGGALISLLVVWRVGRLLHERDVARQAAADAAVHDSVIAQLGGWALEDRSIGELLVDSERLLSDALPELRLRIVAVGASADASQSTASRAYPITANAKDVARIVVTPNAHSDWTERDRGFLEAVAAVLSSGAQQRAVEARLRHDALHDPLTGLANRVLAMDRLEHLLTRRGAVGVTILFIDLDGFKRVNDTCGHSVGDRVLKQIAHGLELAVRASDTVARLAGDEFLVIIPAADDDRVRPVVDRVWDASRTVATCADGGDIAVTGSIGVASAQSDQDRADSLLRRADAAMYIAKEQKSGVVWAADLEADEHAH